MKEENSTPTLRGIVPRLSPELSGKQRRFLRGLGHHLDPVVLVGQRGISDNLVENFVDALEAHELVKVKCHDPDALAQVATVLHERTGAQLAQQIGHTLLFYLQRREDSDIRLPRD
jgi:RNA-binding protein